MEEISIKEKLKIIKSEFYDKPETRQRILFGGKTIYIDKYLNVEFCIGEVEFTMFIYHDKKGWHSYTVLHNTKDFIYHCPLCNEKIYSGTNLVSCNPLVEIMDKLFNEIKKSKEVRLKLLF